MIYRIEENIFNRKWELIRNSDDKIVSTHDTYKLAEHAEKLRLDYLASTDNLCDCGNWKGSDYETCYECRFG